MRIQLKLLRDEVHTPLHQLKSTIKQNLITFENQWATGVRMFDAVQSEQVDAVEAEKRALV